MATSDNSVVPSPEKGIDNPEIHRHAVTIENAEEGTEEEINIELDEADALFGKRGHVDEGVLSNRLASDSRCTSQYDFR
jgi:hypothetical protein